MLDQYAKGIEKALGTATTTSKDYDGETLWIYLLGSEQKTAITFSLSENEEGSEPGTDTRHVAIIRIGGEPRPGLSGIHGITLGSTRAEVIAKLGEPDTEEPRTGAPGEILDWKDRNYGLGLNAAGRVDLIEIAGGADYFPKMGDSVPDPKGFRAALQSRDRETILEWIASDLDLYTKDDEIVGIVGSPREAVFSEDSLIARYLYGGTGSVRDLLTEDLLSKGEGERDEDEETTYYTVFPEGSPIGRILWTFQLGRWRVWDVDLAPEETRKLRFSAR